MTVTPLGLCRCEPARRLGPCPMSAQRQPKGFTTLVHQIPLLNIAMQGHHQHVPIVSSAEGCAVNGSRMIPCRHGIEVSHAENPRELNDRYDHIYP
jgi:hypothetical protein